MKNLLFGALCMLMGTFVFAETIENNSIEELQLVKISIDCHEFADSFTGAVELQNTNLSSNELVEAYNWALTFCYIGFRIR